MAAKDFPASPVAGQVFENWVWNATNESWDSLYNGTPPAMLQVSKYASDSARTTAIPSPAEGMITYLDDINQFQGFQDTTWRPLGGLAPVVPSTVRVSGGSATANSLGKISFTNASSIGLDNVFSSKYSSYKIFVETTASSYAGTNTIVFRQTSGGTATSSALFYGGRAYINVSAFGANDFSNGNANFYMTDVINSGYNALGTFTELTYAKTGSGVRLSLAASAFAGTTAGFMWGGVTWNEATTNYDGFRLSLASAGTFTGNVYVFGINA